MCPSISVPCQFRPLLFHDRPCRSSPHLDCVRTAMSVSPCHCPCSCPSSVSPSVPVGLSLSISLLVSKSGCVGVPPEDSCRSLMQFSTWFPPLQLDPMGRCILLLAGACGGVSGEVTNTVYSATPYSHRLSTIQFSPTTRRISGRRNLQHIKRVSSRFPHQHTDKKMSAQGRRSIFDPSGEAKT